MMKARLLQLVFLALLAEANSFQSGLPKAGIGGSSLVKRYNFLKNIVDKAFENDESLSGDKSKGQYDSPGEEFDDPPAKSAFLTETQIRWRETQLSRDKGVLPELLEGTTWDLDLYLAGIPERDPSNDLYGSKVNISSRDKATGLSLPSSPSTTVTIDFLKDGICRAYRSEFASGQVNGEWKLSDDGRMLRLSIDTLGYTKTVETKGSIQKIYWSDDDEKTVETSTTYFIPPGLVYGDVGVAPGRQTGTFELEEAGVLRIEQPTGLFGISSKMVACGKFKASEKK